MSSVSCSAWFLQMVELGIVSFPVSAYSSFCLFCFVPLSASAQRPEDVIQRYMEAVAGVPDEVNESASG